MLIPLAIFLEVIGSSVERTLFHAITSY